MAGQFITHMKVSAILGFVVAFPYVFWEFWRFVKPALYEKEIRSTRGLVFITSFLFILGVAFGYFLIVPFSINFLGSYQVDPSVENEINLNSYITVVSMISLASGILFELPIVVYFLSKVGLVTPAIMKQYRKHAIVIILILSAVITPPDVTSQILIAIPIVVLYELSIGISRRVQKKREKELA
jgi:sec-independent protein translocase protein TatC